MAPATEDHGGRKRQGKLELVEKTLRYENKIEGERSLGSPRTKKAGLKRAGSKVALRKVAGGWWLKSQRENKEGGRFCVLGDGGKEKNS